MKGGSEAEKGEVAELLEQQETVPSTENVKRAGRFKRHVLRLLLLAVGAWVVVIKFYGHGYCRQRFGQNYAHHHRHHIPGAELGSKLDIDPFDKLQIVQSPFSSLSLLTIRNHERPHVEFDGSGNINQFGRRIEMNGDLTAVSVYIPNSTYLSLDVKSERLELDGIFDADVRNVGSIFGSSYGGSGSFESHGDIKGQFFVRDSLVLRTHSGSIDATVGFLPFNGSANIVTAASSGSVDLNIENENYRDVHGTHEAHSGSLSIYYPSEFVGAIKASVHSGSMTVLGAKIIDERRTPAGGIIIAKKGDGKGDIFARAQSGSVTVVVA